MFNGVFNIIKFLNRNNFITMLYCQGRNMIRNKIEAWPFRLSTGTYQAAETITTHCVNLTNFLYCQGCNHRENLVATSAMVGRICPPGGNRVRVRVRCIRSRTGRPWFGKLSDMCQKENQTKWLGVYSVQSYEIKSPPWTILWFRILEIFYVENTARLGVFYVSNFRQ